MKFRNWFMAALVALLVVGCGSPTVKPVARVGDVVLSRQELDQRIKRIQDAEKKQTQGAAQQQPQQSPQQIEQDVVELFIQQNLLLNIARQRNLTLTDKEIDDQITQIRNNVEGQQAQAQGQPAAKLDDVVQSRLGLPGATSTEFRQFVSSLLVQQKLAPTLVTTDTVQKQVTEEVNAEAKKEVEKANAAHILVDTEDEAKQVLARLDKGEKFEDLAKELSKDPGSKDKGGLYEGLTRGQTVAEFDKAVFEDLKPGETTKTPVKTQFGYHIIRLISRTKGPQYTEDQAKQIIEQQVPQRLDQERQQALQKLLTDERKKAKDEGRLEEPVYPTAVPEQPVPQPGQGGQPPAQGGQPEAQPNGTAEPAAPTPSS